MRLIDADALGIGTAKREAFVVPEYADGWNSAIEIINNAPTISPDSLVKRGRWENNVCSNCFYLYDTGEYTNARNFCPNCGAMMED